MRFVVLPLALVVVLGAGFTRGAARWADQPQNGTANVWVDPDGGACRRSATPTAYSNARACASLGAAYAAASSGDTVAVTAGTYDSQDIGSRGDTKPVSIRAAPGAAVTLGPTRVYAANVTLANVLIQRNVDPDTRATLEADGDHQTFIGVNVDSKGVKTAGTTTGRLGIFVGGSYLTFRNGSVYDVLDEKGVELVGGSHVTFDDWDFHDVHSDSSSVHAECMYNEDGYLTITNSRFWNCYVFDINFTVCCGNPQYGNITLENNVFAHPINIDPGDASMYYSINFNSSTLGTLSNWRVVNNTFESDVSQGGTGADFLWANNVGQWGPCITGGMYSHNVGTVCDPTDRRASGFGWVDPSRYDFHLAPGSPAIGAGDPSKAPTTDGDGVNRPRGGASDAGAYEYGVGILAAAGLGGGAAATTRISSALQSFEEKEAADLLVTLGNNDYTRGRAFVAAWRARFGWLRSAHVGVAGVLGDSDVAVRRGRYEFATLQMPAPYYVRRLRDAEVIVLDSSDVSPAQTRWLERTLAQPTKLVRIAVLSRSPFSCAEFGGDPDVREEWVPLFQRYGVGLVLGSGDSNYQRFVKGNVTYVVAGELTAGHSKLRGCASGFPRRRAARAASAFVYLRVGPGGAEARVLDIGGKTIGRFRVK